MHQSEFNTFAGLLERMALVFGKKKLEDGLVDSYWKALKDQALSTVQGLAERHIRTGKYFPKPAELRPKDTVSPETNDDGKFKQGEERAMERLEEMRQTDPRGWMAYMEAHKPDSRALTYANTFGPENIWYDIPNRCWRRVQ